MERLIRFFVRRHLLVHVMVATIVVAGYISASRAPRETYPNVTLPLLIVSASLPGASARDIETKVTIPIQEAVQELDGVRDYYTVVTDSLSVTVVELHDEFDTPRIAQAEQELKVLLDDVHDFPPEMESDPSIDRINPQQFAVIRVALAGPTDSVIEAARTLERKLRRHDLVGRVKLVGLQDPEVQILVDPTAAREHGVTLLEVVGAIKRRNISSTGGILETETDRRQIVLWSRYEDPLDVASTVLRFLPDGGGALLVGDIARVEATREDTGLLVHTNGRPGISVMVYKREDADILTTVDAVKEVVAATALPRDVEAIFVRDESFLARNRLNLIFNNGILGGILVSAVLFVFLTPIAASWTLAGIPIVFLATLSLFPVLGFTVNMVTLTGLIVVLGMVVDDAVVVSERIVAKRQAGMERHEAAIAGATEMARPVIASAITTILAFMPLWALGGRAGLLVDALPSVVILALTISLLESFLVLPGHMSLGHRRGQTAKRPFMLALEARYRRALRTVLRRRGRVLAVFAASFALVIVFVTPRVGFVLFPQADSDAAHIKITMPIGTPLEQTEAVTAAIERQLPGIMGSDLVAVTARIGHQDPDAEDRERGASENEAVVSARIARVDRRHTSAEWIAILQRELVPPEQAQLIFQAAILGPPIGQPITVHVAGDDHEERRATASEIAETLRSFDGVVDVEVDERPGIPQIELGIDYAKLALRGLDAETVGQTLQAAFHGIEASEHRELDETTTFRVMLEPSARRSLDDLLDLPLRSSSGQLVQLRNVVNPLEIPAVSRIYHRNGVRTATIRAQFAAGSPHTSLSMADRIEKDIVPRYAGVPGLQVYLGGEAVETRKTAADMKMAFFLTFTGITLVIAVMLGSFLEAAFVVAIIPFAFAGVFLTFFLHGESLSMFAMMGTLGLAGVVVNASIVMVDGIHRALSQLDQKHRDDSAARRDTIIEAVVSRLRPIIVTSLTTLGGVLPTAYGIGGHDAIISPMSLAIGWGLAISTSVTLFLVPVLYTLANDFRKIR